MSPCRTHPALLILVTYLLCAAPSSAAGDKERADKDCWNKAKTQADLNECAGKDFQAADHELNAVYKKAVKGLNSRRAAMLKDSETLWIQSRDKDCRLYREIAGGCDDSGNLCGTIAPMEALGCEATETHNRIDFLKSLMKPM